MKDSVVQVTLAGIIGVILMDTLMLVLVLIGVNTLSPWEVAADVFLAPDSVHSAAGTILGLIGTTALSVAAAVLVLLTFRLTGFDYVLLKGIIVVNAFGFITIGMFMPLLNIAPHIQKEPLTNFLALLILTIVGGVQAYIIKRMNIKGWARN